MANELTEKNTVAFFDGQNLFHAVRESFGYTHPNYDVLALAKAVCKLKNWKLVQTRFYTGIPDPLDDPFWNHFWSGKLSVMGRQGVHLFSRSLRYRNKLVKLPDGKEYSFTVGEEKGIDVRIALDIVRMAHRKEYDVALVFSQDQDLSEVADEIRTISREQRRWLKMASAFPVSPTGKNKRGINKTDWITIDRMLYESCLDTRDYRPKATEQKPV